MEYEFYIDLFFLTDCYLNLLSLFLTAAILRQSPRLWRICLAAAIGSFWNCMLIVYPIFSEWTELLITVFLIGNLMIRCSFSCSPIPQKQMPALGILLMDSALVNGCMTFGVQHFRLNDWEGLVFTGLICILVRELLKGLLKREKIGTERYQVWLYYKGKKKEFLALADSGNRLKVPETGKPVSLISYRDCSGFCDTVQSGFYLPYRAVGTENGLLFTVLFEKMEIIGNGRITTIENPAVAIIKEGLSADGDFTMILPEEYVPGE